VREKAPPALKDLGVTGEKEAHVGPTAKSPEAERMAAEMIAMAIRR
jgi:hypothetical protein